MPFVWRQSCPTPFPFQHWFFPGIVSRIPYRGVLGVPKRLSRWTPGARGGEHTFALVGLPRATTSGRPRQHTLACPEVVFSPHHPHPLPLLLGTHIVVGSFFVVTVVSGSAGPAGREVGGGGGSRRRARRREEGARSAGYAGSGSVVSAALPFAEPCMSSGPAPSGPVLRGSTSFRQDPH